MEMEIKNKLLDKLKHSPIPLFDLSNEEISIVEDLIYSNKIIKFIDNGSCNYPISTLHKEAYYIKLVN